MSDLVWFLLGYLDGRDRTGRQGNRCCCAVIAIALVMLLASGAVFMASR
ncbi:hypothetical protein [Brachybacterium tyrofermentans]|uniref:Uncharacterized protein n=1 Tax=Brachybacterium tyrofermentans TaxID=47848 RepID=A0ABW0FD35_9MICO